MALSHTLRASHWCHACILLTWIICTTWTTSTASAATTAQPQVNRRMAAAEFAKAGKREGLEIWRVENFSPVTVKPADFGKFHEGDSYIILKTKDAKGKLSWNIHYWLGSKTSQDESGAAAILAVELDDALGGAPVQHREVQEHETQMMLSYFPSGVRYLPGGVASGFQHVNPNSPDSTKKLYQVKGKRNVRIRQVEPKASSMNKGDCFILDSGKDIYVYYGTKSKRTERLKAVSAANQIRDQDHAGRASVKIIDESASADETQKFFEVLGSGSASTLAEESKGGDDEQFEKDIDNQVSLYKVSDASGGLKIEKVGQKPLSQSALNSNDCFILDTVTSGIYAWIGRRATKSEKEEAIRKGQEFLKTKNYPQWTQITRVVEGGEPSTFKQFFGSWRDSGDRAGLGMGRRRRQVVDTIAGLPMNDEGNGQVTVLRVDKDDWVPIDVQDHGMFSSSHAYVVKYRATEGQQVAYLWAGKNSPPIPQTSLHVSRIREFPNFVKVNQGYEPHHFNLLFKGRLIIMDAPDCSALGRSPVCDQVMLFRVAGTDSSNVRAEQYPPVAASLDSGDVFLLKSQGSKFLWFGKGSNMHEQEMARNLRLLSLEDGDSTAVEMNEGSETDDFWGPLGGQGDYNQELEDRPVAPPRLFQITDRLQLEEIFDFKKKDLDEDDVFVLKNGDEEYVWIGSEASKEEVVASVSYWLRTTQGSVTFVASGREPEAFTALFPEEDELSNDI